MLHSQADPCLHSIHCGKITLSEVAERKMDSCYTLTAVVFIRSIAAVIVTVTQPYVRNTPLVVAREVVLSAGGGDFSGTVRFIRTVATIVHAVTVPTGQDAVLVVAGERLWRAGRSWKKTCEAGSGVNDTKLLVPPPPLKLRHF